jgi:hypothetical protein
MNWYWYCKGLYMTQLDQRAIKKSKTRKASRKKSEKKNKNSNSADDFIKFL